MGGNLVLEAASVFTGLEHRPGWAVAVRDGRIAAVGPPDSVREAAGSDADVVRVPGGMVVPGFQDAHVHPPEAGLDRIRCDLHELPGLDAYRDAIRSYVSTLPADGW